MNNFNIVVADSGETSRKMICKLLVKKGYKIYQATDGAGVIRIARRIYPDLVIIDENIWGIKSYEAASIIEEDKLSTVIFITNNPSLSFYERLKTMNVFAYINKPINPDQLYQIVEFSIMNSSRIKKLKKKVKKLEDTITDRKNIDRAKHILMKKHGVSEDEAYKMLRKKSMDECISMGKVAEKVIAKYG
ncbi:ANTAR domain-containing response regulator [Wukongibacter sp. M2B1]|uniref:ANTAR domain-containing response regulator n=1 Tax=Wukongibacter sp. M2B1 TaxID=3088895 RepID=UPI003D7ACB16